MQGEPAGDALAPSTDSLQLISPLLLAQNNHDLPCSHVQGEPAGRQAGAQHRQHGPEHRAGHCLSQAGRESRRRVVSCSSLNVCCICHCHHSFEPSNCPASFEPSNCPGSFEPSNCPASFEPSNCPASFQPNNCPASFEPNNCPAASAYKLCAPIHCRRALQGSRLQEGRRHHRCLPRKDHRKLLLLSWS